MGSGPGSLEYPPWSGSGGGRQGRGLLPALGRARPLVSEEPKLSGQSTNSLIRELATECQVFTNGKTHLSFCASDLAPAGTVGINDGNPGAGAVTENPGQRRSPVELSPWRASLANASTCRCSCCFYLAGKNVRRREGRWLYMAFLAIDPGRANQIDFTAPYIEIEGTYLVPAGSPVRAIEDVDRKGVRMESLWTALTIRF